MLVIFFLFASAFAAAPLTQVTIYVEVFNYIEFPLANCTASCPQDKCLECTLTTLPDCTFTDFLKVNGSVGIYATKPSVACQRDSLYFYTPGSYRLTINRVGKYLQFLPFLKESGSVKVSIDFVLGYSFE